VATCKLGKEVKRRPDEAGKYFRAECRDTKVAPTPTTKNGLLLFPVRSVKQSNFFLLVKWSSFYSNGYQAPKNIFDNTQ